MLRCILSVFSAIDSNHCTELVAAAIQLLWSSYPKTLESSSLAVPILGEPREHPGKCSGAIQKCCRVESDLTGHECFFKENA